MIIVMKDHASAEQIAGVVTQVEAQGFKVHLSQGEERTIIGVIGDERPIDIRSFEALDGVERTVPILKPYKLASREMHPADTLVPGHGPVWSGGAAEAVAVALENAPRQRK